MREYEAGDEITLRELVEILRRRAMYIWAATLLLVLGAGVYAFLLAKPVYSSSATLSVAPVQVRARLENKIQVQQASPITFGGLKALALSNATLQKVWQALRDKGALPKEWESENEAEGVGKMRRSFAVRDISPKAPPSSNQIPPVVAELSVRAPDPELAAQAANLWVEEVKRRVNQIPIDRLKASLSALGEQIAPAEKAYKQAEAQWEAFTRSSTLDSDRAELQAKIQEGVRTDQELHQNARDLASVRAQLASAERAFSLQKTVVPLNLPPDQVALVNRTLGEARRALAEEVSRARRAYQSAADALEAFRKKDRIALWKAELGWYTKAYADYQNQRLVIEAELAKKEALLKDAKDRLEAYQKELSDTSLNALTAGLPVGQAEEVVSGVLTKARSRLKAAEAGWEKFQKNSRLEVLKRRYAAYASRLAEVMGKLERAASEKAVLEARLAKAEDEIAGEPRLLTLEREITADPAAAAIAARKGDLRALIGLKLKNQTLNPAHESLLTTALKLRADLAALEKEVEALGQERSVLEPSLQKLQADIAAEEDARNRKETELRVARELYQAVYRYAEDFKKLLGRSGGLIRERNPDVLKFRDRVVGLEAEIAGLKAERAALAENIAALAKSISALQSQLASQEKEKAAIELAYRAKQAAFDVLQRRYDQLANLKASDLVFDNPNPQYQALKARLINLRVDEARLEAQREALLEQKKAIEGRVDQLKARVAQAEVEKSTVEQALSLAREAYLALVKKRTDLQIQIASNQKAWASVLAPAFPVYEKVAPKRGLILALSAFLGLMLGGMLAFLAEALAPEQAKAA